MFFKALACDFDGTLASEDRVGPAVREALVAARRAGLRLVLVTGRTFFELTRVCDCLELFDGVVAELSATAGGQVSEGVVLVRLEARAAA